MSEFKRQTAEARLLTRVGELAQEEGIEVSLRSRSSGGQTQLKFSIFVDMEERDDSGLVLLPEEVRFYEEDATVQAQIDDRIRTYLKNRKK